MAAMLGGAPGIVGAIGAAEFDRGAALYENHCTACHDPQLHKRETHHVTTLADLRARVAAWSIHSGLNWSDEDIDDVTDFLNRRFYRLTNKP